MIKLQESKTKKITKISFLEKIKRKILSINIISIKNYLIDLFKHYFGGLYIRLDKHHVFMMSSSLTFSIFTFIIPFVLVLFWLLGHFLNLNSTLVEEQITRMIDTIIPYQKYSDFAKKIIFDRIHEVIQFRVIAGYIGAFGLLFASSGIFGSIRTILNTVFEIKENANIFLSKLRDFGIVFLIILLFLITTFTLPLIDVLRSFSEQFIIFKFLQFGIFQRIFTAIFTLLIITFIFYLLYRIVPFKKLHRRSTFAGALWAAILWEVAKEIFGFYIYNFAAWGKLYGIYAIAVVIAFWIYYSSIVFIIGAEISKLYNERLESKIKKSK